MIYLYSGVLYTHSNENILTQREKNYIMYIEYDLDPGNFEV